MSAARLTRPCLGYPDHYSVRADRDAEIFRTVPKKDQRAALQAEKAKGVLIHAGSFLTVISSDKLCGEALCDTLGLTDAPLWINQTAIERA